MLLEARRGSLKELILCLNAGKRDNCKFHCKWHGEQISVHFLFQHKN